MQSSSLRWIYLNRSARLFALFLTSSASALALALYFPLWMLAFSPLIFGVPHLVASLRYFPGVRADSNRPRFMLTVLSGIFFLWALARVLPEIGVAWPGAQFVLKHQRLEMAGLILVFFLGARACGLSLRAALVRLFVLIPFLASWFLSPLYTLGLLVLGHHFIGFGYWIRAASSKADRISAWLALASIAGLHAFILFGLFDGLLGRFDSFFELPLSALSLWSVGGAVFPVRVPDPTLWSRALVAYAFGQSVHYFVWLRAIPESHLPNQTPTSFRQSFGLFESDFGKATARGLILAVVGLAGVWTLIALPLARVLYTAIAAFHGFAEIAGLCLPQKVSRA